MTPMMAGVAVATTLALALVDRDDQWRGNRNNFGNGTGPPGPPDDGGGGPPDGFGGPFGGGPPAGNGGPPNGGPPNDPDIPVYPTMDGYHNRVDALAGSDWYRYILPRYDLSVPVNRDGTHLPWHGWHPTRGLSLNFPASTGLRFVSKVEFLQQFTHGPAFVLHDVSPDFRKGFPKFTCVDTKAPTSLEIIQYAVVVGEHCHRYGIYCPPVHTVNNVRSVGWWFADLPPRTQEDSRQMDGLLAARLQASDTGLHKCNVFSTVLHQRSGYMAFTELLRLGQHPRLHLASVNPRMPRMRTGTIRSYLDDWRNYLYLMALSGEVFCDVYVARAFHCGLHRGHASIASSLQQRVNAAPPNVPIPGELQLDQLVHTIRSIGTQHNLPRGFIDTPPQDSKVPAIRQLMDAQDKQASDSNYALDSEDFVRAMMRSPRRRPDGTPGPCYFCRHPTELHKRADCPLIKELLQDDKYKAMAVGLQTLIQRDQVVREVAADIEPDRLAALHAAMSPDDSASTSSEADFQ